MGLIYYDGVEVKAGDLFVSGLQYSWTKTGGFYGLIVSIDTTEPDYPIARLLFQGPATMTQHMPTLQAWRGLRHVHLVQRRPK
jgi:hypothetical protein